MPVQGIDGPQQAAGNRAVQFSADSPTFFSFSVACA